MMKPFLVAGLLLAVIAASGCSSSFSPALSAPVFEIEATVSSLNLDVRHECDNTCKGTDYPKDTGILLIEKLLSVRNPGRVSCEWVEEGESASASFYYSAQKARVIRIPEKIVTAETQIVLHSSSRAIPVPKEDETFVYTIEISGLKEESSLELPGLEEGMRLRASAKCDAERGSLVIEEYEVI